MIHTCRGELYTYFKPLIDIHVEESCTHVFSHWSTVYHHQCTNYASVKRMHTITSWQKMDVQTEECAIFKFSVPLKKPIPYNLAQLMEAHGDKVLQPSTIKNCPNFMSDNEVVNGIHTFFNSLDKAV